MRLKIDFQRTEKWFPPVSFFLLYLYFYYGIRIGNKTLLRQSSRYSEAWWSQLDLNQRPSRYQHDALTS